MQPSLPEHPAGDRRSENGEQGGTSIASVTSQKAALLLRAGSTTAKQSSAHISGEIVEKTDGDIFSAIFILPQAVDGTGIPAC